MDFKPFLQDVRLQSHKIDDHGKFPMTIPAIRNFSQLTFHRDVTFIVGENGSGKSTFIEAIAESIGLAQEGGSRYLQAQPKASSSLADALLISKSFRRPKDYFFLRAESLYNVASALDNLYEREPKEIFIRNYGVSSLHHCSHGESFLAVMANRLSGNGLYLFDEPEAALSPSRQLTALHLIDNLVKQDSQFIIATHSPILLAYPNAYIYQFDETGIKRINYEETEAFSVTKDFLNNYRFMMNRLL